MKLYIVEEVDGEWCIFVFAERANLARVAYCNIFGEPTKHIDVRAQLMPSLMVSSAWSTTTLKSGCHHENRWSTTMNADLIEANRDRLLGWYAKGRSYFWMAMQLGISERASGMVSAWFRRQGIYRKEKK